MLLGIGHQELRNDLVCDNRSDGTDEERHRRRLEGADNKAQDQVRHQAALSVMHVVAVAHPGLGLAANLALHTVPPALGLEVLALAVVVDKVLGHGAGLGNDNGLCIGAGGQHADDGRLTERVNLFELRGRKTGLCAVEDFEVVRDTELLEEPDDTLGARLGEPEDDKLAVLSACLLLCDKCGGDDVMGFGRTSRE